MVADSGRFAKAWLLHATDATGTQPSLQRVFRSPYRRWILSWLDGFGFSGCTQRTQQARNRPFERQARGIFTRSGRKAVVASPFF
jgi:hypothetical protein